MPGHFTPGLFTMDETKFWEIIDLLDWDRQGDDNAVLAPAMNALMEMPVEDIFRFDEILAEKLHQLDTEEHARNIGEAAYVSPDVAFSVDEFLYARCVVVANGREVFEEIVAQPEDMPEDLEFEAILFLAAQAYEEKTGKEYEYVTETDYETFANKDGWTW